MDRSSLNNLMYLTPSQGREHEDGRCHICLEKKKLTREHVPPRSAYNHCDALWHRLETPNGAKKSARSVRLRGGFVVRSLCQDCNNSVCSPYAKAYVTFVKHLVESPKLFDGFGVKRIVSIPCSTLLLAKEIATMILAIEPVTYGQHYPELRYFVLDPKLTFKPNFRVYAFLVPESPKSGTITRAHGRVDTFAKGYKFLGGEISRFPFGFVFASELGEGYDHSTFTDITHWFFDDRENSTVSLASRLTGVDSIQCGVGSPRTCPQIDFV